MRYRTHVDPVTGRTLKSGLDMREVGTQDTYTPRGGVYRAVVLKTYATDDSVRTEGRPSTTRLFEVECDILLTRSLVLYPRVPVMQPFHGVNDASLWIPRPSTRVIGGQDLNFTRVSARGTLAKLPPNLEDLDGDKVLVQFVEGDPEKPIVVGCLSHPKTLRLFVDGSGWSELASGSERGKPHKDEKYLRYRGVEVRINDAGDVLVDTVGATSDEENEVPGALGGQMRIRVKGTERFTVELDGTDILEVYRTLFGEPRVDLIEGGGEQFIRGTTHIANLDVFLQACQALSELGGAAGAVGAAASVGPLAAMKPAWVALGNAFAQWGGLSVSADPGVIPVPPLTAPVGVFKSTLVDEQALSTKIRGD